MLKNYKIFNEKLEDLTNDKMLINTINAYSYSLSLKDSAFAKSLSNCQVLIPDGISIVWANKILSGQKLKKIAGADLFYYEMNRLKKNNGKVFFLGSNNIILNKIKNRAAIEFPNVAVFTYSPPYKPTFNKDDSECMINAINEVNPDVLFVGMTAPKQEKWAYEHFNQLEVGHIGCIGAVFDFYAGSIKRAPDWMVKLGLEWLYRLFKEPKRLWKRYLIYNNIFLYHIFKEKIFGN